MLGWVHDTQTDAPPGGAVIKKKKKLGVSNTPYIGGWWVTDGNWWATDGNWWVTAGGWWVTAGGPTTTKVTDLPGVNAPNPRPHDI
jgi:hypothetical protein